MAGPTGRIGSGHVTSGQIRSDEIKFVLTLILNVSYPSQNEQAAMTKQNMLSPFGCGLPFPGGMGSFVPKRHTEGIDCQRLAPLVYTFVYFASSGHGQIWIISYASDITYNKREPMLVDDMIVWGAGRKGWTRTEPSVFVGKCGVPRAQKIKNQISFDREKRRDMRAVVVSVGRKYQAER